MDVVAPASRYSTAIVQDPPQIHDCENVGGALATL
eukprot:SAG31_NODE_42140_length_273_cov_0.574713_1_plen_34_part_01